MNRRRSDARRGQFAGFDAGLRRRVALAGDDVGGLAGELRDGLGEARAAVDQAHAVVGAVGLGEGAVGHQPVDQGRRPGSLS